MAFTLITITGKFIRPDSNPSTGTITATLSEPITNAGQILNPTTITGILDSTGRIKDQSGASPFVLEANNDPASLPVGSLYYFTVLLDAAPGRLFKAVVPYNAASGTIDIIALITQAM